ncbi:FAD-binding molybdopterin dehydrogenase [Asanoa ishikariensis]|uniref:Xanthine dehydrogenase YagS FAD-binding subunit n=1 Tax=Asanoa ishikariensis TaxID=137265 RepID=A0A1H3UI82_9ACTN|nr:xanthine dehydrogenase family protein subunit M [Asanoa ishikariensis]GIF63473.1 FAD-binding molybdopterin dehydrogenase [Asanoa ishikariensis]SDZ62036.1 xanthine dehydrogenase YagS FAD-binding subunit [Asanoa ishikariensis]
MRAFRYARATDPGAAAALVTSQPDAVYLGGGTNLVDLMKLGVLRPGLVVDVSRLPYDRIEHLPDGGVLIGGAARNRRVAHDEGIRRRYPALARALLSGASGQIRSQATVAGNLLQRTRCPYFQNTATPCNKRDPGSGCSAIPGAHRDLGVIGTSEHCVATHPSDLAVALAAYDAVVEVRRPDGAEVLVPIGDLHRLPGDTPWIETVLEPGDLVTGVQLPPPPDGAVATYRKVRDRWSFAFATVSVAAVLSTDQVRLALGGVAPKPWRLTATERMLAGTDPSDDDVRAATRAAFTDARPLPENAFKIELAADLVAAVLRDLRTAGAVR